MPLLHNRQKNRQQFYTKNLKSFIDYARRQASKYGIKGSRINAALQILELLKTEDPFEDHINEEFKSLDARIPKNPDKIPIKEFDSVFKDILKQIIK